MIDQVRHKMSSDTADVCNLRCAACNTGCPRQHIMGIPFMHYLPMVIFWIMCLYLCFLRTGVVDAHPCAVWCFHMTIYLRICQGMPPICLLYFRIYQAAYLIYCPCTESSFGIFLYLWQTDTSVLNPIISQKLSVARFTSILWQSYYLQEIN